jgi:hypothetical protein
MMVWMSMEMLGSVNFIWWDFGWEILKQIKKADVVKSLPQI